MGVLTDPACASQHTWVELELQSTANKEVLQSILNWNGHATVVFEGEFFGPAHPDPKLPEAIRKADHPGWGHLGAFMTKLVVHVIRSVKAGKQVWTARNRFRSLLEKCFFLRQSTGSEICCVSPFHPVTKDPQSGLRLQLVECRRTR
jgi:hypothetical protein